MEDSGVVMLLVIVLLVVYGEGDLLDEEESVFVEEK